ncbi:MAG: PAS domain-containing protein [Actinomycetota bacterium]
MLGTLSGIGPLEMLAELSDAVMVSRIDRVTGDRTIEWVNPAFERLIGLDSADVVGRGLDSIMESGSDEHVRWGEIDSWLKQGKSMRVQMLSTTADGPTWLDISLTPLPTDGPEALVIGIGRPLDTITLPEGPVITRETFLSTDDESGLALACASCSKFRTAAGNFKHPVILLRDELGLEVSHGLCQDCFEELSP